MIEELAKVIAVDDNCKTGQKKITVQSQVKSSCSGCNQLDSCGSGQIAKAIPQRKLSVILTTDLPVKIGDTLVLGLSEKSILKTAWQVYLWPLFGLIIGSALGQWFIQQGVFSIELYSIVLGGLGGYIGHRFAKYWQRNSKHAKSLVPKILRIQATCNQ